MYDWANSGFATSGGAAIFPVYFVLLFKSAMGDEANFFGFSLTGSSMWSLGVALSTAVVAVTSPVLGIIADRVAIKKTLLWIYTAAGSIFTVLAFFSAYTSQPWIWLWGTFFLGNIGFAGALVFYNSFLPHIVPRELYDDVSSRGFAYGYVGGGLLLAVHLVLIMAFTGTAIEDLITRVCIGSIGIWWFGWAIWTFRTVPEPAISNPVSGLNVRTASVLALRELGKTLRQLARFKVLVIYLGAYLLFNDGIQTVMAVAGAFAADTLGVSLVFNMLTILIIQFIAAPGALAFAWLAAKTSTKFALTSALLGWCVAVLFGVGIAPLVPSGHSDFDYQFAYDQAGESYLVESVPELSDSDLEQEIYVAFDELSNGDVVMADQVKELTSYLGSSGSARFSFSIVGGPFEGAQGIGNAHPSSLGEGAIDWWPATLRSVLWSPLGLSSNFQWLILGSIVGVVMGGSQALARSLFAQMTPMSRSGEFFSFFGFMSRASALIGPMVYLLITGFFDTRLAILTILIIIVLGTVALKFVDVQSGQRTAELEDAQNTGVVGAPN